MVAELGHFALVLALSVSITLGVLPLVGAHLGRMSWCRLGENAAYAQFALVAFAFLMLTASFLDLDFTVRYVAANAHSELPWYFRISAVWGAHEGSLLLWVLILSGWTLAVAMFSGALTDTLRARILGVLGLLSTAFLLFMLATSNPFERLIPGAVEGRDLNPLLQDFGLIVHPPMLYMGYVGLAVPFAFAVGALLGGQIDAAWVRWTRPWTILAWVFLTLGISLGSWWAYYELGWGGWWFWDPVENASFMPWLVATALMHSLAVTEQRGAFKSWTVLLAILAFSLSLLGTFLVRSGVLVSVHAFASDPDRGMFILAFLGIVFGGAILLFLLRADRLYDDARFELLSRETLLLVNNVLLVVAAAAVLLGTLYPLASDAFGWGKISVGPPWFEAVFVPLMIPLLVLIGIGPSTRWRRDSLRRLGRLLLLPAVASVVLAVGWYSLRSLSDALTPGTPAPGDWVDSLQLAAGLTFAAWILVSTTATLLTRLFSGHRARANPRESQGSSAHGNGNLPGAGSGPVRRPVQRAYIGMVFAHLGMGVFVAGVTVTSLSSIERDVALTPGQSTVLGGYRFEFQGVTETDGPNYRAQEGRIRVTQTAAEGTSEAILRPQKRWYRSTGQPMTEAAIDASLERDLYVALGEPLGNDAWALRVYHKPYVRWIWLGGILMGLGGLCAASDRRYRQPRRARAGSGDRTADEEANAAEAPARLPAGSTA